ncbi:MAG: hypothetical protein IT469_05420 [Pseudomonadales bacterium]|nr:hypothetical protein [Pseudomonadales bacterium]
MRWAIEIRKTSLQRRNLADLLKGLGFDLIEGVEYPAFSSAAIDSCTTATDAFEIAKKVRSAFNGPAKIDPDFVLGSVIDYATTPARRYAFLEPAVFVNETTIYTPTITISPPEGLSADDVAKWEEEQAELQYQTRLEHQRKLLEPAFLDPKSAKVIALLCFENPSGETLYKIYELVEGNPKNREKFHARYGIDKDQFNRFRDAVHNPSVTGDWARHAYDKRTNSLDPMTKEEAEQFVREIADRFLHSIRQNR